MRVPDDRYTMRSLARLIARERPATSRDRPTTDDRSNLDYVQAPLRLRWRTLIWDAFDSSVFWD